MVQDLTGLGKAMEGAAKIADSQLANKAYDDGLQGPTRQVGELATDVLKSFRLVMAPFQLMAVYQDRLKSFCDRVRAGVPEERQIEARPEIAGPILMEMRFIEDASPLAQMYEKLLQKAIDRDYQELAHPAFVKIISQLSLLEVRILENLRYGRMTFHFDHRDKNRKDTLLMGSAPEHIPIFAQDASITASIEHLSSLLIIIPVDGILIRDDVHEKLPGISAQKPVALSEFGRLFLMACRDRPYKS